MSRARPPRFLTRRQLLATVAASGGLLSGLGARLLRAGDTGPASTAAPRPGTVTAAPPSPLANASITPAPTAAPPAAAPTVYPPIPYAVASGDVTSSRAIVWSRADRPVRMIVDYATTESFHDPRRVIGPAALEATDFTARVDLGGLQAGQPVFYRVSFLDLETSRMLGEPLAGRFRTAPDKRRDVRFAWSGDLVGQGWGINPDIGGMKIFESMRRLDLDFFIHSGDYIYADNPLEATVTLPDGRVWHNLVTLEKSKVAETLNEFRGNFRYNLLDDNFRRFIAEVPQLVQWDDHEVHNNWYPGQILEDARYQVRSVDLLSARAKRAFQEYTPMRLDPLEPERIYRNYSYGPGLEVFMLDMRTYRAANNPGQQLEAGADTVFLGAAQVAWLKEKLKASRATWKVIAADMPLGLIVRDGQNIEAVANGDGQARGRELEIADLLRFMKKHDIRNTVWLTTDVHYAAAHYYDPGKAKFSDFLPFWEFVAGPLNAGTFGPNTLDDTFGPQLKYISLPPGAKPNMSPLDGCQFFGAIKIDGKSERMTVAIHDLTGKVLYSVDLEPDAGRRIGKSKSDLE